MHLMDELKDYVSACPQSLAILRESQAKQDESFEKSKAENKDTDFGEPEGGEDWNAGLN
jgi:hypothetical protein